MTRGEWQSLDAILDAALAVPPENRGAVLDNECSSDPGVRAEIEELLQACDKDNGFLEDSAAAFGGSLFAADAFDFGDRTGHLRA